MKTYSHKQIEDKWQKFWAKEKQYEVNVSDTAKKFYNLVMFPYPSGDKLHIGHWYNYSGTDIYGRFKKLQGYNVMQPIGFDSFGLPAENYAIKTGIHPDESTNNNIKQMRKQLKAIGAMWDWSHEVVTSSPEYYKWTQWVFLQLYKHDLAYRKNAPVNWCPSCQTVLANEQVQDGTCDRCSSPVTKKSLTQWFFKITDYADKLLDHSELDWPEKTVLMQKNWIGKSTGCNINFKLSDGEEVLTCYTTRPDTLYSVTFVVIAPEHPLVDKLIEGTEYEKNVKEVRTKILNQTDIERTSEGGKDKLGAFTGKFVINPATNEKIPVFIANFALMYGTGVVMADAHDERDYEFAQKYEIALKFVISEDGKELSPEEYGKAYVEDGILFNSGEFSGLHNREALPKMIKWIQDSGFGEATTNYRLRDWLISRQRYWGAPIPIVYDPEGNAHVIPEEHLPWLLPTDVDYNPKGVSPLATSKEFVERTEKIFGVGWRPEVDTMDTFVCSSWYFLRYPSANLSDIPFDKDITNNWLPVDMYVGGPEHACMHLLYARFIHQVLHDLGMTDTKEPFKKLVHQGLITKDGAKMSKSKGNVVSPDEFVEKFGSDVFRMYLMFMGPFTDGGDWNDNGIMGIVRFKEKFWKLILEGASPTGEDAKTVETKLHQTIKKVGNDLENYQFNTAIAALMEFVNLAGKTGITEEAKKSLVKLVAPLAPHLAEECFLTLGGNGSIFNSEWPKFDPKKVASETVEIAVQVNGKLRGSFAAARSSEQSEIVDKAAELENVKKFLDEGEIVKTVYVPEKLVNFVVK